MFLKYNVSLHLFHNSISKCGNLVKSFSVYAYSQYKLSMLCTYINLIWAKFVCEAA